LNAPEIITLGCRLNIAESAAMQEIARDAEDLIVVNSCAVTAEAVRNTRQAIRQARRRRPDARLVVTGCAAQTDPDMFAAMPEVSDVVGNDRKLHAESLLHGSNSAPTTAAQFQASGFADRTRGFVVVQNGCDHSCTFCIIPQGRGASRSLPAEAVVDQVRRLVEGSGVKEVVLTGVDLTSYGADLPGEQTLGTLVERILKDVPALPRLRLSSLDGVEIDARLFELLAGEPRVMPHVHLSLQAGDDLILKRMKRRHNRTQAIELVQRLRNRRPEIAVGADIIAGFPTEDEEMFAQSVDLVSQCRIVHGHIFPYSPRPGTPAARMPQVNPAIVRDRARCLREACAAERETWLEAHVGRTLPVLVERSGVEGHAPDFASVRLQTPAPPGQIITALVSGVENGRLIAQEGQHG
jgi:threonylcarbamoyladenosine tRNA methylthiotransferase MtaB